MTGVTPAPVLWSAGNWDAVARTMAPIHDRLVEALAPQPGERWLDVATADAALSTLRAVGTAEIIEALLERVV